MKISLAFTTYKTRNYIYKQLCSDHFNLSKLLVNEIVIRDDCSIDYESLKYFNSNDIKITQNDVNLSPLNSRPKLVADCKNEWVLMMDADNFLDENSYKKISELVKNGLDKNTIYCPDFARPRYPYKKFSGKIIDKEFAKNNIDNLEFKIFINTGNYLVPRESYIEVSKYIDSSYAYLPIDTVYFNYLWLKSGKQFHCVNNYEYEHTIRDDSFAVTHADVNREKSQQVYSLIRSL